MVRLLLAGATDAITRGIADKLLDNGVLADQPLSLCVAHTHFSSILHLLPNDRIQTSIVQAQRKVDWQGIRQMRACIRAFKPDIIHAFYPRYLAVANLATFGMWNRPKILSYYGITRLLKWYQPDDRITYLNRSVSRHACESNAVKDALVQSGIPADRCDVVYNAVRDPIEADRDRIRDSLGIQRDAFVIGTIANIRPVKGVDLLLQAILQLGELIPNLRVVLAGTIHDSEVERLLQHPSLKDKVVTTGFISNPGEVASAMDLFVMPSRKEALCQALVEAMQQNVCCVISEAGGMKELVRDQIDGRVFPVEDVNRLVALLRELYADATQRERLALQGKRRAFEMCGPSVVAERLLQMYSRVVAPASLTSRSQQIAREAPVRAA